MIPRKLLGLAAAILILYVIFGQNKLVTVNAPLAQNNAASVKCGWKAEEKSSPKMLPKFYDDALGIGPELVCGQAGIVHYKIWDLQGNLLAETESAKISTGDDKFPYGLELMLVGYGDKKGMRPGGKRTAIIPPDFMKTSGGKPIDPQFPVGIKLPDETLIIALDLKGISPPEPGPGESKPPSAGTPPQSSAPIPR